MAIQILSSSFGVLTRVQMFSAYWKKFGNVNNCAFPSGSVAEEYIRMLWKKSQPDSVYCRQPAFRNCSHCSRGTPKAY